jgi:hypothetical protein
VRMAQNETQAHAGTLFRLGNTKPSAASRMGGVRGAGLAHNLLTVW